MKLQLAFLISGLLNFVFITMLIQAQKDLDFAQGRFNNSRLLVRAIDGDTIELDGGERVRILNINTPETWQRKGRKFEKIKDPDPKGVRAYEYVRSFENRHVRLTYDKKRKDMYGRTLAHVYVIEDDIDLGVELIRKGWAKLMFIPPNMSRYEDYKELKKSSVN